MQVAKRTNLPKIAGILELVAGAMMTAVGVPLFVLLAHEGGQSFIDVGWLPFGLSLEGIIALVGGVFALKRKAWGVALAGAICSMSFLLGIPALVFLAMSKNEFK